MKQIGLDNNVILLNKRIEKDIKFEWRKRKQKD